jgi:uncharacterized protein YfiM (DUF2279 family)
MPLVSGFGFMLSGTGGGSGSNNEILDTRAGDSFGYLYYSAAGASAILTVNASHNQTAWLPVTTFTAVTGAAGGTALFSAFYPYLTVQINALYSGAAGTANVIVHYTPGLA